MIEIKRGIISLAHNLAIHNIGIREMKSVSLSRYLKGQNNGEEWTNVSLLLILICIAGNLICAA